MSTPEKVETPAHWYGGFFPPQPSQSKGGSPRRWTLKQLARLRERNLNAITRSKTPERIEENIDKIESIASKGEKRSGLTSLPKKKLRELGVLPPVGQYLCHACDKLSSDRTGWKNVTNEGVGFCPGCVATAEKEEAEAQQRIKELEQPPTQTEHVL